MNGVCYLVTDDPTQHLVGTLHFSQDTDSSNKVIVDISKLEPSSLHAIHILEVFSSCAFFVLLFIYLMGRHLPLMMEALCISILIQLIINMVASVLQMIIMMVTL